MKSTFEQQVVTTLPESEQHKIEQIQEEAEITKKRSQRFMFFMINSLRSKLRTGREQKVINDQVRTWQVRNRWADFVSRRSMM